MKLHLVFSRTLIFLLVCVFVFVSVSGELFSEKLILLEFKSSVFDPSGILSTWEFNSSDHCSWFGVSCDSKSRVFSLNITGGEGNSQGSRAFSCSELSQLFPFHGFGIRRTCSYSGGKLVGKLTPLIVNLTELRVLSLPHNGLSGEIPSDVWSLEKLEVLDLEGNSFTGKWPDGFVGLRNLRVLNLGFNKIYGEIPVSLSQYVNLEVLSLAGNEVNGTIPEFFGSFLKLRGLYLSYNHLIGSIPSEFGLNCRNLEHLDLSGNFLVGQIPVSLGECRQLRTLLLFSNMLDGVIPRELGRIQMLEVLDISRNNLSGPIPTELGNCVNLSVLVLKNLFDPLPSHRNLSGDLLDKLSGAAREDYNHFQGSIPVEITSLSKLRVVWVPRATLEGKIMSDWGACKSLEMVNLAENLFSGELGGVFGGCGNLHFLDLSSNRLTGELDKKLHVPCMTLFDVSGNLLSGSIPRFNYRVCPRILSSNSDLLRAYDPSFPYLSFLAHKTRSVTPLPFSHASLAIIHNFGCNNLTGPVQWLPLADERLGKQTDYAFLAGGNKLTGTFPGSLFGNCDKLNGMIVNVTSNKISSQIPLKIGAMCRSLRFLDASENQICGSIPRSFGYMKSLVAIHLGGNKLQGPIPEALDRLKYLKFLSLAGNNLRGTIPSSLAQLLSLEVLELYSNSLSGGIPQGLVNLRNLTVLLLNNNKLSGEIPSGLKDVTSLTTFNVSYNNLSGLIPLRHNVINCSSALGNPLLYPCHMISLPITSSDLPVRWNSLTYALTYAVPPSASVVKHEHSGLKSIEMASIISASAIVLALLLLVIFFFYTRKRIPDARVQVSESKEITVFSDIGVPLTYENIVRATGNFNASNLLGSGGFGATYKADISPGNMLAVKRLAIGRFQGAQQFHAEIKTLERVRHANLVTLIGYHASETEMFLVYNYLPGGNLENFIKERSTRSVDWKILHKIALDIARALNYLHVCCVPRVLHRDVKPSNILLDNEFNAYLSDFGLSRLLGTSETHATTGVAGTFGYVAPEYAMTCRVTEKADVYSYGVMLLELISDKKALDPSFSTHGDGFNIVSWACMMMRQGQAKEVFTAGLWEAGPEDHLVDMLHLAIMCTVETLSIRPTMKQVVQRLKQIHPGYATT